MDEEYLIQYCNQILIEGNNTESILLFLRDNGCSKTQSIKILKNLQFIPLDEAQNLVHLSQTWQDVYEYDEELNRQFYEVLMGEDS